MALSGKAADTKLRGRIDAGFAAPSRARLEGVAPFGRPVFVLTAVMILPGVGENWSFVPDYAGMQKAFSIPWIPSFDIDYLLGVDGISFPLIMLTAVITALSMGASWPIDWRIPPMARNRSNSSGSSQD